MNTTPVRDDPPRLPVEVGSECDRMAEAAQTEGRLPAFAAAVSIGATTVWQHRSPFQDGQFRIGSITKTMTAVAVMQLRDAGRVDLTAPISRYVPDAPAGNATIRQLLTHSSGIGAEPAGPWWERSPGQTWSQLRFANEGRPPALPADSRHHYSNLGYALLGELIARAYGCSWFDAIRASILDPLGLRSTSYLPMANAVQGTSRRPDGRLVAEPAYDYEAMAPAGQLWSTTADLSRWASFLVTGADEVLGLSSLEEMATVHSADPAVQHLGGYGLGLRLWWRSRSALRGHTGSVPGFLAALAVDPVSRVGAVALADVTTGLDGAALTTRLIDVVEPALTRPQVPDEARPGELPDWATALAGDWYHGNTRSVMHVDGAELVLTGPFGRHRFRLLGPDRLRGDDGYFAGEELLVRRRGDGSVSHLDVATFLYSRAPYDPSTPVPGGLPDVLSGWP